ncbi:hypothetical protein ALC53_06304 [Atta colombica]|uniref:Uncharacterized protein n=1 Tax=Atta colombica TaxID=520822 RepID=A0A195BFQ5_9HYME|nr:hypothetical protein ALC53_06304 [Atta colombica]
MLVTPTFLAGAVSITVFFPTFKNRTVINNRFLPAPVCAAPGKASTQGQCAHYLSMQPYRFDLSRRPVLPGMLLYSVNFLDVFRELIIYFHKLRRYVFMYRIVTIGKNYIQLADYSWPSCPNSQQNFPVIVTVLCGTGGTKLRFSCGQEPSNPIRHRCCREKKNFRRPNFYADSRNKVQRPQPSYLIPMNEYLRLTMYSLSTPPLYRPKKASRASRSSREPTPYAIAHHVQWSMQLHTHVRVCIDNVGRANRDQRVRW